MLFSITEHCSLGCPHCFMEAGDTGRHASVEVVEAAVGFAKDMGLGKFCVSGGEPTEHPEFFKHFEYVLKELPGRLKILMTNGSFLKNPKFVRELSGLCREYSFYIQVSALKHLYPHRSETVHLFKKNKSKFPPGRIHLIENITSMTDLGRAKGKDWSRLGPLYNRTAPMCFNLFSVAYSGVVTDLKGVVSYIDRHTKMHCTPLISYEGNLHIGETALCISLGNILSDGYDQMYDVLLSTKPCGSCGIDYPRVGGLK